jgi:hypothetical protein
MFFFFIFKEAIDINTVFIFGLILDLLFRKVSIFFAHFFQKSNHEFVR